MQQCNVNQPGEIFLEGKRIVVEPARTDTTLAPYNMTVKQLFIVILPFVIYKRNVGEIIESRILSYLFLWTSHHCSLSELLHFGIPSAIGFSTTSDNQSNFLLHYVAKIKYLEIHKVRMFFFSKCRERQSRVKKRENSGENRQNTE